MKKFNHRKIKEFRIQNGLTQEEVADFLGVSQSTYYRLESGIGVYRDWETDRKSVV